MIRRALLATRKNWDLAREIFIFEMRNVRVPKNFSRRATAASAESKLKRESKTTDELADEEVSIAAA